MHCQPHAPVATRDPVGRTSVHRPKIAAVGLVNLHAYARPNVNYEVSLRQLGLTHLFQVARAWRAPSSLVDVDRGLCHVA